MTFKFFQKKSVDEACTEHSDCETLYCSAEYQTCRPLHDEWQVSPNVADDPCECIPVTEHENERYYGCDPFSANMNKDPLFGETKTPWCQTKNPDECDKKVPYTNFINVFTTYAGMSNVDDYHSCGDSMPADKTVLPSKPSVPGYKWIDHYYDPITGKISWNEDGTVRRRTKEEKVKALEQKVDQLKKSERDWNCYVFSKEITKELKALSDHPLRQYCMNANDIGGFANVQMGLASLRG